MTFTYPSHTTKGCVPLSSDVSLSIAYERFVKDLKDASDTSGIEISLGTFKQDNLSEKVSHAQDDYQTEKQTVKPIFPQTVSEDLCKLLNQDGQSSYSFSKTIADYLLEHGISIDYFRVISRTGNKCKEAFPFPNSTFMEIMDCFQVEDPNSADALDESEKGKIPKTISYSDSAFAKAIERVCLILRICSNRREQTSKELIEHLPVTCSMRSTTFIFATIMQILKALNLKNQ